MKYLKQFGIIYGIIILFLAVCRIDYDVYHEGAKYISFLLTPATVCLAVPLYEQLELLKKNHKAHASYVSITAAVIIVTGVLGNMIAETVCKVFKIYEPIAKGIAIGTASHAIGTARAMEMGPVAGANVFARFM